MESESNKKVNQILIFWVTKNTTIEILSSSLTQKEKNQMIQEWSSYKGRKENALALGAEEGRSNLR